MLMDEYVEWKSEQKSELLGWDEEDQFSVFYQHRCFGKTFVEMLHALAYEVYELQVCVEGLIEDNDRGG